MKLHGLLSEGSPERLARAIARIIGMHDTVWTQLDERGDAPHDDALRIEPTTRSALHGRARYH